jgi:enoyl-CoA hydratase/carnithine racemase
MIRTRSTDGHRTVVLDRPAKRNALTREGLAALQEAIETADEPVIYLIGAGTAFGAGADLDVVSELSADSAAEFARQGQQVAAAIDGYDGAVVAGIDGAVRGGGLDIALACDLRVATPDATLAANGVRIGLVSRIVEEPRSVAAELAARDGDALRAIKRLVRADTDRETAEKREATAYGELIGEFDGDRSRD